MKKNIITSLFIFFTLNISAQMDTDTLNISKKIDSINKLKQNNPSLADYKFYKKIIKDSEKLNYSKGILHPYIWILDYHSDNKSIDSLFFYSQQFEKRNQKYNKSPVYFDYLFAMGHNLLYKFHSPEYALPYYIESFKKHNKNDITTKFKLINGITHCYMYKEQYHSVISEIEKVIKDTIRVSRTTKNVMKMSLALAHQYLNETKKSIALLDEVIKESGSFKDSAYYVSAQVYQSRNYYLEGDYNQSINLLNSNFEGVKKYWPDGVPNHYEFLSISLAKLGQYDNAIIELKKALDKTPLNELPKLYSQLIDYHIAKKTKDSAIYYHSIKNNITDSIRNLEKKMYVNFYKSKLDFVRTNLENEKIKLEQTFLVSKNKRQRYYIVSLLIGFVCLILLGIIYVFYKKSRNSTKKIQFLEKNEKDILHNHIRVRENELSILMIGISRKMKTLEKIRNELKVSSDASKCPKLKSSIKSFDTFLKNNNSIDVLTDRIESQYPGLVKQLKDKYPNLSKTNIKHCLLVKLGFSVKDSANLLNVTVNTVKTARYRAKVKMGVPEEVSLLDFINDNVTKFEF